MTPEPVAARRRRLARAWRALLIIYVVALTAGTHWPKLDLIGDREFPPPDKLLHVLAFSGLMVLMWRSRWIHSLALAAAVALTWAVIDEVTQALPGLGREVSWEDASASMVGVVLAATWMAALRPVGGRLNRMRLELPAFALDQLCLQVRAWVAIVAAFAGGVAASWLVARLLWDPLLNLIAIDRLMRMGFFLVTACGFLAAWLVLVRLWRTSIAHASLHRSCFACGTSHNGPAALRFDENGAAACSCCGAFLHRGQWIEPRTRPPAGRRATAPLSGSTGLKLMMVVTSAMIVSVMEANPGLIVGLTRLDRLLGPLAAPTTSLALDLGVLGVALAVLVRVHRVQRGRVFDRQGVQCVACGHDLRGTPVTQGVGNCGECGTPFVQIQSHPGRAADADG